jgi:hypothetical protein
MKRILLAACLAASLVPFAAEPASACSCAFATPEEHADNARVVFTGRARSIERDPSEITVRFRVNTVYKGNVDRRVTVVTASNSAACGCSFREGVRYTVFGSRRGDPIPTNLCSGTKKGGIDPDEYGLPPGHSPS